MPNAFHFGAKGDGLADDTAALQHTLDAGGGVLTLAKGNFRITKPITLDLTKHGYGAIRGAGGTTRILMEGAGPAFRVLGSHGGTATPRTVKPKVWEKERFPTVTGLEILGKHPEAVGVELRKTMQMTVTQMLIRNCKIGLHLVERNRNFVLSSSHIYDNSHYGVFFDRCNLHQTVIEGNHISYNRRAGIKSLDGDVHNLHITGNDIEYNNNPGKDKSPNGEPTGAEIWFESPNGKISEVSIASNTLQATVQPGGANVRIWGNKDNTQGGRLIAISGNVIGSQTRALDIRSCTRVTVSGNTIYDSTDLSMYVTRCIGFAVNGNTFCWNHDDKQPPKDGVHFEDCEVGTFTANSMHRSCSGNKKTGGAITLVRCKDVSVADCQIVNPLHRGIEIVDCERVRVADNNVADNRDKTSMREAIRVRGKSPTVLVSGNIVTGGHKPLIDVAKEAGVAKDNLGS